MSLILAQVNVIGVYSICKLNVLKRGELESNIKECEVKFGIKYLIKKLILVNETLL